MIGKSENKVINLYDDKETVVGSITTESNSKKAMLTIGERKFLVTHDKWKTVITENDKTIYNLKTSRSWANTTILETGSKITGVWGLKWGTQLTDKDKNTLVKIRNINKFFNKSRYEIKVVNDQTSHLDILIALYFHIYSSKMKMTGLITMGVI